MTSLSQLSASQASPEVPVNENFDTVSVAGLFGKRHAAMSGLTWGYYGGLYNGNTISDGTVTLTNASDNYVVVLRSTGVVSVSTTDTNSLDTDYAKLYKVTVAGGAVTAVVDQRADTNGHLNAGSSADAVLAEAMDYADSLVVGLLDDRGNHDASGNVFPSSGGSGAAGAILKGDLWTISVAGTLGGHPVTAGDVVRALVDTPGSTDANWAIIENNFGFAPAAAGAVTASGITMATAKMLGRSTASTGAVEEITVGSGLSLSGGTLSAVGGGGGIYDATWFDVTAYGALGDGSTDDTVAVQAAIDACEAAGGGTVYFPRGVHIIAGALQDTGRSNSQLLLPRRDYGDTEAITIVFRGEAPPSAGISVIGATPIPDNLSIIKGTLNVGGGTSPAMIGAHGPVGTFGDFTNMLFVMRDLVVQMPADPVLTAIDLNYVAQADIDHVIVHAGSFDVASISAQTTSTSYGIRTPGHNNGALSRLGVVNVVGFYNGYQIAEHCNGSHVAAWACKQGLVFVNTAHGSHFGRLMLHHCQKGLVFTGGVHYFNIDQLNIEHAASGTWVATHDIDDGSNYGHGVLRWHVVLAGPGPDTTFTVNGGATIYRRKLDMDTVFALTDAATIAVNANLADNFRVTLGGNRTLGNPTNLQSGQTLNFRVHQDGTGNRTLAYASKYKFSGGAPSLSTAASAKDFISCQYDATDDTLYCSIMKGMA